MARTTRNSRSVDNGADLGFGSELGRAASVLRSSMDAAEYKHDVPGRICLEYIGHNQVITPGHFGAVRRFLSMPAKWA